MRGRLRILRRAEHLEKKKEEERTAFYRDPFKFVQGLFSQEKGGHLKSSKLKEENYLRKAYSDLEEKNKARSST